MRWRCISWWIRVAFAVPLNNSVFREALTRHPTQWHNPLLNHMYIFSREATAQCSYATATTSASFGFPGTIFRAVLGTSLSCQLVSEEIRKFKFLFLIFVGVLSQLIVSERLYHKIWAKIFENGCRISELCAWKCAIPFGQQTECPLHIATWTCVHIYDTRSWKFPMMDWSLMLFHLTTMLSPTYKSASKWLRFSSCAHYIPFELCAGHLVSPKKLSYRLYRSYTPFFANTFTLI